MEEKPKSLSDKLTRPDGFGKSRQRSGGCEGALQRIMLALRSYCILVSNWSWHRMAELSSKREVSVECQHSVSSKA